MNQQKELDNLKETIRLCQLCKLCKNRKNTVFGEGNSNADILFIGEGPGKQEDATGRPFVGRAGELLTRIIEDGAGISRSDVFIANIVKCRPTIHLEGIKDRKPEADEVLACTPYLEKQIRLIAPKAIISLGSPATSFLLQTKVGITRLRGTWHDYRGIPVMPTFHPSYVLRNGGDRSPLKKDVCNDIKLVIDRLSLSTGIKVL